MNKLRNPIGLKRPVPHAPGYFTQIISIGRVSGYVKIWRGDEVFDRALTVRKAQERAQADFDKQPKIGFSDEPSRNPT